MKYPCWFYMNIYKALSISCEPLGIFYVFATRKGKSALNIVTDYNSEGFFWVPFERNVNFVASALQLVV